MLLRLSEAAVSTTYLLAFVEAFIWSGGDITLGMWERVGGGGVEGGGRGMVVAFIMARYLVYETSVSRGKILE